MNHHPLKGFEFLTSWFEAGFFNPKGKLYIAVEVRALQWQETEPAAIVNIYRTILNQIQNTAERALERDHQHELMRHFLASLPLDGMLDILERHTYQRLYRMFFKDWLLLDYHSEPGSPTMAELTLQNLKDTLEQPEVLALKNLIKSYVSLYRIHSLRNGYVYLENLIMPREHYKIIANYDGLMVGDILVARLLPGPSDWLLFDPWIILLPLNEKLLAKSLHRLIKKAGYHKRNFSRFCKKKTILLLQMVNQEVGAAEKDVVEIGESLPLCLGWQEATVGDCRRIMELLKASDAFLDMYEVEVKCFLFFNRDNPETSWGYILLDEDRIAFCVPPQEDLSPVLDALNRVFAESGERMAFSELDSTHERIAHYNSRIIEDLSMFLQNNEEMINDILIPHSYTQYSQEQSRSDFFTKLSLQVGEHLQKNKRATTESPG